MKSEVTTMQVRDVARQADVPAHVVRYYTQIGLLEPLRDPGNRYRLYSPDDIYRVKFIRRAKALGFTLNEIRAVLHDADAGMSPCHEVREIVRKRLEDIDARIAGLRRLKSQLKRAEDLWSGMPDSLPDHGCLCHLIDAVSEYEDDLT